jgi:hypothetical protein
LPCPLLIDAALYARNVCRILWVVRERLVLVTIIFEIDKFGVVVKIVVERSVVGT